MPDRQLRKLVTEGWSQPVRGVYVVPAPHDPFRAGLRAALLARPDGAACSITAARLYELWGLPQWNAAEVPQIMLCSDGGVPHRRGMRLHFGLEPERRLLRGGFPVTDLGRTVNDVTLELPLDDLVCLLEAALHAGWTRDCYPLTRTRAVRVEAALRLADVRSESPLETAARLLFVRNGIPPEAVQFRVFTRDGACYARLDLAWPSRRLAVELDGRQPHDDPRAPLPRSRPAKPAHARRVDGPSLHVAGHPTPAEVGAHPGRCSTRYSGFLRFCTESRSFGDTTSRNRCQASATRSARSSDQLSSTPSGSSSTFSGASASTAPSSCVTSTTAPR